MREFPTDFLIPFSIYQLSYLTLLFFFQSLQNLFYDYTYYISNWKKSKSSPFSTIYLTQPIRLKKASIVGFVNSATVIAVVSTIKNTTTLMQSPPVFHHTIRGVTNIFKLNYKNINIPLQFFTMQKAPPKECFFFEFINVNLKFSIHLVGIRLMVVSQSFD